MKLKIITANIMVNETFIGLGSNINDRHYNLNLALQHINQLATIIKKSSIYETEPVGYKNQNKFLNMVIEITTNLSAYKLFKHLQNIEKKMGRIKTFKNGPRIIDLDVLLYGQEIIKTKTLEIPHPRIQERSFVLKPLAEIAPELIHPKLKTSIINLLHKNESRENY